jgi:hypothetical protein
LFDDEGGQFIGGHAMNKDNILKTIAGLSKLWEGAPISRVRSGQDESFMLHGCRFSCHLRLQPMVADIVLNNRLLQSQGILARFLISKPQSLAGTRLLQQEHESDPAQDPRLGRYWSRMIELLEMPWRLNQHGELEPRDLTLSIEAKRLWIGAYNAIEQQLGPQGKFIDIQATAAKAAENILRMAGVIEFTDNLECALIEEDSLHDAIKLMQHYLNEAVRLANIVPVPEQLEQAQELLEWLKARGWSQFTLQQVYKTGPRFARSASQARALLNVLKRHYWVVAERDGWRMR